MSTAPSAAKNDIRGVETGKSLADALDTWVLEGARCPGPRRDRIEGERKHFTGERLLVDPDQKGAGTVSLINEAGAIEKASGP